MTRLATATMYLVLSLALPGRMQLEAIPSFTHFWTFGLVTLQRQSVILSRIATTKRESEAQRCKVTVSHQRSHSLKAYSLTDPYQVQYCPLFSLV